MNANTKWDTSSHTSTPPHLQVGQAQKHIDNVGKWFEKALGFAKVAEDKKRKEEERVAAEAVEKGGEKQPEVRNVL